MSPRELSQFGFSLVSLAVLWILFGPWGWLLAGLGCLLIAALCGFAAGPTSEPRKVELVTCPSCYARESADRAECRACGEPL